ncbi:MAG: dipeptidase [Candidatus Neomarinimicrobiota bacterium]
MKIINNISFVLISMSFLGCDSDASLLSRAKKISQRTIITDGHIDIPWRLTNKMEDVSIRTKTGDFDYVRAKEGGLDAPFMSIYVPSSYQAGGAKAKADELIDLVLKLAEDSPDKFKVVTSTNEAEKAIEDGLIALPMGMENGAPIENDLSNITYFYKRGIRYITLTHGKDNLICDSSYDTTATWGGLSDFGHQVVNEMNRLGIMVDISHVSDNAFYDVMKITKAPAIASHSSCRVFTPGFERNMNDSMIKTLADNGGVIQINFGSSFLTQDSRDKNTENSTKINEYAKKHGYSPEDKEMIAFSKKVQEENPIYADVTDVIDHIDHVVKIAGIDHVAFGSDFDGVGDSLPYGIKDASQFPNLIFHLLKRGYSEEDIQKICYKNIWRVWNKVDDIANSLQNRN